MTRIRALAVGVVLAATLLASTSRAEAPPGEVTDDALFASAVQSLHDGRPSDAVAQLEALADRGVVDGAASYDRGLAYIERVRAGGEQPGDLGRAAHGFEEAKDLAPEPALVRDASNSLSLVRAEVARRRSRAGEPVELDQGASLGRTIVRIFPEDGWAMGAAVASLALGAGLFVRRLASTRRLRIGAGLTCALSAPLILLCAAATLAARHDRIHLREGVIVSPSARPSDARGIALPNATPLPEAARVELLDAKAAWTRVRWGAVDAWVPSSAVRPLAKVTLEKVALANVD